MGIELFIHPWPSSAEHVRYCGARCSSCSLVSCASLNFADLTAPMLLFHLLTFDPKWIPTKQSDAQEWIFYDGTCGLCHRVVRFVLVAEERRQVLVFAAARRDVRANRARGRAKRPAGQLCGDRSIRSDSAAQRRGDTHHDTARRPMASAGSCARRRPKTGARWGLSGRGRDQVSTVCQSNWLLPNRNHLSFELDLWNSRTSIVARGSAAASGLANMAYQAFERVTACARKPDPGCPGATRADGL